MSTHSYIGKELDDGKFQVVYCHSNGYLSYNGELLYNHYNSLEKVDELLKLGDISSLGKTLEPQNENNSNDGTRAFGRDKGETDCNSQILTQQDLEESMSIDYVYIFSKEGKWVYAKQSELEKGWRNLGKDLGYETEQIKKGENEMRITKITTDDLRKLRNEEGLILQGCGGDLKDWVNGINEMLSEENILKNGSQFENVSTFDNKGVTCLYFPFKDVDLDMGKLAIWRLKTHEQFGGTWMSDYVDNRLGGFEKPRQKPDCPLIGQDSNIYNLMGIASRTLRENGMQDEAKEMVARIQASGSYDKALCIIGEYVNITSVDDEPNEDYEEENEDDEFFDQDDDDGDIGMGDID